MRVDVLPSLNTVFGGVFNQSRLTAERDRATERERLFLLYAKQWWREVCVFHSYYLSLPLQFQSFPLCSNPVSPILALQCDEQRYHVCCSFLRSGPVITHDWSKYLGETRTVSHGLCAPPCNQSNQARSHFDFFQLIWIPFWSFICIIDWTALQHWVYSLLAQVVRSTALARLPDLYHS